MPRDATLTFDNYQFRPALSWQIRASENSRLDSLVTRAFLRGLSKNSTTGQLSGDTALHAELFVPTENARTASFLNLTGISSTANNASSIGFRSYIDIGQSMSTL